MVTWEGLCPSPCLKVGSEYDFRKDGKVVLWDLRQCMLDYIASKLVFALYGRGRKDLGVMANRTGIEGIRSADRVTP